MPKRNHDRVVNVRLTSQGVIVDYRLEADEWTVVFVDLPAVSDQVDLTQLSQPREFYKAYTRCYGPILADNLTATLNGKPLTFTCVEHRHEMKDSLICDFVFRAPWTLPPDQPASFQFHEGNFELEAGLVRLSLTADPSLTLLEKNEPDEALKSRPAMDLRPGDDARLRQASATIRVGGSAPVQPTTSTPPAPETSDSSRPGTLLGLLLDSRQGLALLLVLATFLGAAHALTPGHGKTLVAAYLVGERGTVWHALLLGLVTTLTHTGAVLVVAAILPFFPLALPALQLIGGLAVAGVGFWLLLCRLTGHADHVHLGGHGHHHHHHHDHDAHGHTHPLPTEGKVSWWSLVLLGVSGGIVPCVDAIVMLVFAVSVGRLWLALPLLLAFSAGLAAVLIVIGIVVVSAKSFAQARLGRSGRLQRVFNALPLFSAVAVICLGLWMCRDSVTAHAAPPPAHRAQSQP